MLASSKIYVAAKSEINLAHLLASLLYFPTDNYRHLQTAVILGSVFAKITFLTSIIDWLPIFTDLIPFESILLMHIAGHICNVDMTGCTMTKRARSSMLIFYAPCVHMFINKWQWYHFIHGIFVKFIIVISIVQENALYDVYMSPCGVVEEQVGLHGCRFIYFWVGPRPSNHEFALSLPNDALAPPPILLTPEPI